MSRYNGEAHDTLERIELKVDTLNSEFTEVMRAFSLSLKDNTEAQREHTNALNAMGARIAQAIRHAEKSIPLWVVCALFGLVYALIFGVAVIDKYITPMLMNGAIK